MPELSQPIIIKLFLLLRILPVIETIALYLFLIGGVAFVLLSICAVIFISTAKIPSQQNMKPSLMKNIVNNPRNDYLPQVKNDDNKEMEVYFTSLLAPTSDNEEV